MGLVWQVPMQILGACHFSRSNLKNDKDFRYLTVQIDFYIMLLNVFTRKCYFIYGVSNFCKKSFVSDKG